MVRRNTARKLFHAFLTVFVVLVFNYWLFRVLPGNPLTMLARNPRATPEMMENITRFYGLDMPWYTQFFRYFANLLRGDLGDSFVFKAPVTSVLASRVMPTVVLLVTAEIVAAAAGTLLGVFSAWKRGSKADVATLGFSLFTYAMPTFWFGMIMVSVLCVQLRLLPTSGMVTPGAPHFSSWSYMADVLRHMVLPVLTMAIVLLGDYALTMRNTMTDVLGEDYITTAKAKGFSNRYILQRHAMPNAMLPMVTVIGMQLGAVVGGAVQIETIFSWPGLGRLMYEALTARDYPLLQGAFLLVTASVVLANFLTDILYSVIDPRVRN